MKNFEPLYLSDLEVQGHHTSPVYRPTRPLPIPPSQEEVKVTVQGQGQKQKK